MSTTCEIYKHLLSRSIYHMCLKVLGQYAQTRRDSVICYSKNRCTCIGIVCMYIDIMEEHNFAEHGMYGCDGCCKGWSLSVL